MNLPNKLTVMRMILIPFFVFFMLAPYFEGYGNYIATAILSLQVLPTCWMEKLQESTIWLLISENLWILWQTSCLYALQ